MTKSLFTGFLAVLVWAAATVLPGTAAEPKPSQPYVVLVGINEYADKQITPRPHAEDDVKALYDLVTNKDYLGVDADHVRLLLGKEDAQRKSQPATKDNIVKALEWLKDAKQDDLVVFAFFGEGASLGERGDRRCYLASDSTLKDRDKTAVAAATLGDAFNKLKSQKILVLLDVNFKGFTTQDPIPEATLGAPPYKEYLGDDGTEDHAPVPGRAVYVATEGLSPSLDLDKGGVFTRVVIDALKGAADTEGKEADGVVVVDELTDYVAKQVPELCRQNGKTREQKEQTPFTLGGRVNHFVITRNPAVTAKVREQLDKLSQLIKDKKLSEKVGDEGRELLERMPKLQAQRDLRKAFQELVAGNVAVEEFQKTYDKILEGTKLDPDAAKGFATSVLKAITKIRDGYVKEVNSGELATWAIRGLYKRLDEKVPEDVVEKLAKAKDLKETELLALLSDARQQLGKREDLDNHKDVDIALERMMSHLDPYTTYIDKESKDGLDKDIEGMFTGIGIQIRKSASSGYLQVITPIRGSPAHKKGIQAGDLVTTIIREEDSQGKPLSPTETLSTKDLAINEAVKKILGQPGTKIKLVIEREGEPKPIEMEVVRGQVDVETVLGYRREKNGDWNYYVDPDYKIAYVRLTGFGRFTAPRLAKEMENLKKEGVKGFVLDLRFNPGGLLSSANDVADLFIDDGLIVTVKPRVGKPDVYMGTREGSYTEFPMVCLINGLSASASEIVSACLQDHTRAIIVGERSYGKGSVQNIQRFEGGDLKMTIATYWRPSNKNINKSSTKGTDDEEWGVRPNKGFQADLTTKERDDLYEHQRNSEIIERPDKYDGAQKKLNEYKDIQLEKGLEYLREKVRSSSQQADKK
ncbi:MAG TPA: S41 family peptidase [Gemmataceae bacterium]|nr:S41 family peptidase [Gemmataceae bacterium]